MVTITMNYQLPTQSPTLRVIPMVYDTNPRGDVFGGWLMSQIDIAGSIAAYERAKGPVATIAVKELTFMAPLFVGDIVSFYAKLISVGTTSLTINIEVYAERKTEYPSTVVKVSHAILVYVAVSEPGKSRLVPSE